MSNIDVWQTYLPYVLRGAIVTVQLSVIGLIGAVFLGLVVASARLSDFGVLRSMARAYVEGVRGTPELLQLFIIYFGLAEVGLVLPAFLAASLWLTISGGAYAGEIFRAGLQTVDRGQVEAAHALGLSRWSSFRRVVLPQATAYVLPPLGSFGILLIKASALAYTIGVGEIMSETDIGAHATSHTLDMYLLAAATYFVMCFGLSRAVLRLEKVVERYR